MKTYSFQPWAVIFKICDAHLYSPSCSPSLCGYLMCLKSTLETLANKFWYAACVIPTLLHLREQNKGSEMPPEPSTASPLNWALSWRGWAGNGQWVLSTCSTPGTPTRHKIAFSLQKGAISGVAAGSPCGHHAHRDFFLSHGCSLQPCWELLLSKAHSPSASRLWNENLRMLNPILLQGQDSHCLSVDA